MPAYLLRRTPRTHIRRHRRADRASRCRWHLPVGTPRSSAWPLWLSLQLTGALAPLHLPRVRGLMALPREPQPARTPRFHSTGQVPADQVEARVAPRSCARNVARIPTRDHRNDQPPLRTLAPPTVQPRCSGTSPRPPVGGGGRRRHADAGVPAYRYTLALLCLARSEPLFPVPQHRVHRLCYARSGMSLISDNLP